MIRMNNWLTRLQVGRRHLVLQSPSAILALGETRTTISGMMDSSSHPSVTQHIRIRASAVDVWSVYADERAYVSMEC